MSALQDEERLLRDLAGILRGQRAAIATDDIDQLDDSVFSTHRVLLTLGEARRRRVTLNQMMGEADDLSIGALIDAFGGTPPAAITDAIDALTASGEALQREIDLNARVLRTAVESGNQLVRALAGASEDTESYGGRRPSVAEASLLDRRI